MICGLSGGVDSAVAATLVQRAIGERLTCIFVDHGLLRAGEAEQVVDTFERHQGMRLVAVDAKEAFLDDLAGVTDPEVKRKMIGARFVRVFEEETERLVEERGNSAQSSPKVFLAQGTLYPDVIESASNDDSANARTIKTHHNVGGLPEDMTFELIEPLRMLFKDEVRRIGEELGLPEEIVWRHPFPGPGLGIRILGEVTWERLEMLRQADRIFPGGVAVGRSLPADEPGLCGAAAGANGRRDGRRAHVCQRDRAAGGHDRRLYDGGLGAAALCAAGAGQQPHCQRGRRGQPGRI